MYQGKFGDFSVLLLGAIQTKQGSKEATVRPLSGPPTCEPRRSLYRSRPGSDDEAYVLRVEILWEALLECRCRAVQRAVLRELEGYPLAPLLDIPSEVMENLCIEYDGRL